MRDIQHELNRLFPTNDVNIDADLQTNILETYACRQDMYIRYLNTRTTLLQTRLYERERVNIRWRKKTGSLHRLTKKYASISEMCEEFCLFGFSMSYFLFKSDHKSLNAHWRWIRWTQNTNLGSTYIRVHYLSLLFGWKAIIATNIANFKFFYVSPLVSHQYFTPDETPMSEILI